MVPYISNQKKMTVTDAKVNEFLQSILLPLLDHVMVPFNKMKDIKNSLQENNISDDKASLMYEKVIKENAQMVLEQKEKLVQLEKEYPWLKERFEASSKALFDYCDLEELLLSKYNGWHELLNDKHEVKEVEEIHLALVIFTINRIAYKFKNFSKIINLHDFPEEKSTEAIHKKRKRQIEKLVNEKKIKKALNITELRALTGLSGQELFDKWYKNDTFCLI